MFNCLLSVLFLNFLLASEISGDSEAIVGTRWGKIQGVTKSFMGKEFDEFLGIPYARPPIGKLRFKPSILWNTTWSETLEATKYGPVCMQFGNPEIGMGEDCLFLNIWRPHSNTSSRSKLLPVLLFIHGSAFQFGSAADHPGDILSVTGGIIVVTPNYRLGSLGFAFGDQLEMPGNLGVYDAITALHWLQDNIKSFGGDPGQVTLSGQSAGSMIASLLPGIPTLPETLFRRLFLMSGASLGTMFIDSQDVGLNKTKLLAEKVGCGSMFTNHEALTQDHIDCMRNLDPKLLVQSQSTDDLRILGGAESAAFIPVYGAELIPESLNKLLWKNLESNRKLDIIIGTEKDEATCFFGYKNLTSLDVTFEFLRERLSYVKKDLTELELRRFFNLYFTPNDTQIRSEFHLKGKAMEFITDYSFHCSSLILSELYSRQHRVRGYINHYVAHSPGSKFQPYGPQHGDDADAFFGEAFKVAGTNELIQKDRRFSQMMMEMLSNFVKGYEHFDTWPEIHLKPKSIKESQIVKKLIDMPKNMPDMKQEICLEWSKLLGYEIPPI